MVYMKTAEIHTAAILIIRPYPPLTENVGDSLQGGALGDAPCRGGQKDRPDGLRQWSIGPRQVKAPCHLLARIRETTTVSVIEFRANGPMVGCKRGWLSPVTTRADVASNLRRVNQVPPGNRW